MAKCDCDPKSKRKPTTQGQITQTKTNKGCMVKNVIIINGCCSDNKRSEKKRNTKRKSNRPRPPTERIEVIETPKKTTKRKRRTNYSPSPLVDDYSSKKRSSRASSPKKRTDTNTNKGKAVTGRKSKARESSKRTPRIEVVDYKEPSSSKKSSRRSSKSEAPPLIEVVDYEEPYNGRGLERREKRTKSVAAPKRTENIVTMIEAPKESSGKSLKEAIREYKANRLARRTEEVGRRQETLPVENVPTYIIEKSPKALPSPKSNQETLVLPPGVSIDDLQDVSDCSNLTGANREACLKRKRAQSKRR